MELWGQSQVPESVDTATATERAGLISLDAISGPTIRGILQLFLCPQRNPLRRPVPVKFWTPSNLYLSLGQNNAERQRVWRENVREVLDTETIAKIRHCANTGLVLGTEKFRAQVATLTTQTLEL